jgi:hypothetical protein
MTSLDEATTTEVGYWVLVSFFLGSFFKYLSYHARIRCSKSTLSAVLFGGRQAGSNVGA